MSENEHPEEAHEPTGYGTYFLTWLMLLILTATTVTAAGIHFGDLNVVVALMIAAIKGSIVLFLFMHLKWEPRLFHTLVAIMLIVLVIFIGLTFTDVLFR